MGTLGKVALLVPHEGPGGHSRVHPGCLAGYRLCLIRCLGHEIVFNPMSCQELGVVEIPDHAVMGKVFEKDRHPSVRVGPDSYDNALARPHARAMDFTGRPLKGMVYVAPEGYRTDEELMYWLDQALTFALSLPPKRSQVTRKTRRRTRARKS